MKDFTMQVLFAQDNEWFEKFFTDPFWITVGVASLLGAFIVLALVVAFFAYGKLWLQAYFARADVSLLSLIGMGFRQVRPVVKRRIRCEWAERDVAHDFSAEFVERRAPFHPAPRVRPRADGSTHCQRAATSFRSTAVRCRPPQLGRLAGSLPTC